MIGDVSSVARPFALMTMTFIASVTCMPTFIRCMKRWNMGKSIRDCKSAPVMSKLHQAKTGTPTMGGIVIWGTVLVFAFVIDFGCGLFGVGSAWCQMSFLSRGQTWLPLGLMVAAALVGMLDDYLNVRRLGSQSGGLRKRYRVLSYTFIAVIGALWFYTKLSWDQLIVPFVGIISIGWLYIPFFMLTCVATSLSVNETDGLDGLAGGGLLAAFGAYTIIAWSQGKTDLATLCAAVVGALLGFLWYNVNPAEIFMGDTGAMSLGTVLAVAALMTSQPLLLLIIGLPFVIESLSVLVQVASKKILGRKWLLSSPLHHHLEAAGWPEPRIVMRFWMLSFVSAGVGTVIALVGSS